MQRVRILGVPLDPVTQDEAVARISQMLSDGGKHHVMTPNNEMIVKAQSVPVFKSLLQTSELSLPDSTGLLWAAARTGQHLPERVTGVDTVKRILLTCSDQTPVFFLGGRKGVGQRALEAMQKENPRLRGEAFEGTPSEEDAAEIINKINDSEAILLLVAYGAPKQDWWINQHLLNLTSVKVAMGIGGTFDFLSGSIKRAPQCMQRARLEWLWRLIQQPSRIGRIYTAVIRFPLLVLRG